MTSQRTAAPSTETTVAASAAPTSPPTSACVDEEGSPRYQVATFHPIAPASPANTTSSTAAPCGISITAATVLATF